MFNKNPDKALVDRVIQGDRRGFDQLFNTYFPRLFRFALARLEKNEDWAEEAVQAALSKALLKLPSFRGEATLYTWLCTFCRHEIGYILKREKRSAELVLGDDPDISAALESLAILLRAQDPDTEFQRTRIIQQVQSTLDHMPSLYADLLEWRYIHGDSVADIARRINRSYKAVESALSRARLAFRDAFSTSLNHQPTVLATGKGEQHDK